MNEAEIISSLEYYVKRTPIATDSRSLETNTSYAIQGILDLYKYEKEQNEMLINEKNIYKDLTKQAQEDVTIWKNLYKQEKEKNKELSDKLVEKICNGVEEDILEEYRQRIKELEEELNRQINARTINEEFIEKNYISKDKIKEKIEYQNMLWNTPNRQKEYNQEVVEVLEELLEGEI